MPAITPVSLKIQSGSNLAKPGNLDVKSFGKPSAGNGNKFLRLYETQPTGFSSPWLFAHRENALAAVHALTVIEDKEGNQKIYLLITKRPPLGGKLTIELPAGLWGDNEEFESAQNAANREVREETGYDVKESQHLGPTLFATSPGMTTEHKAFVLTFVQGEPKEKLLDKAESQIIVGKIELPIETFLNRDKFVDWLNTMGQDGYLVGLDVIAARGLLV